jgi:hypothetical protein
MKQSWQFDRGSPSIVLLAGMVADNAAAAVATPSLLHRRDATRSDLTKYFGPDQ